MKRSWRILKWIAFGLMAVAFFGFVTMTLWNWLVPPLFSGPVITLWQALGLLILTKILFWGMGGKSHCYHHSPEHGGHWKHRLYDKFSTMTPEEREVFKRKMREKWCPGESSTSGNKSGVSNV